MGERVTIKGIDGSTFQGELGEYHEYEVAADTIGLDEDRFGKMELPLNFIETVDPQ